MNDLPLQILAWTFGSLGAVGVLAWLALALLDRGMKKQAKARAGR
jgi:hypothetical protein